MTEKEDTAQYIGVAVDLRMRMCSMAVSNGKAP
jgi:hypothetical protein